MSDVFISYARAQADEAHRIVEALRGLGYAVWRDDELPAHRSYTEVIEERLRAAKAVVVAWSADAVKSQWVRAEAEVAREAGTLVQLSLDGSMPPLPFNQIQCADLRGWRGDLGAAGWQKVAASVAALIGEQRPGVHAPAAVARVPSEPLVAILAFDNLSGDPEMSYFSDGVSEEILQTVARGSTLKVIARSSSFQFRGAEKAVRRVAADLKVTHLLDGSVRRSGSRVRIAAQLVDCATETTLWSDRFDRELSDVFALQDEIAAAVAAALKATFAPRVGMGQVDPASYELYLRAKEACLVLATAEPPEAAVRMLRQVTATAPAFAPGWAWLAYALGLSARRGGRGEAFRRTRTEAITAANAAIGLDPRLSMSYAVLNHLEPDGALESRLSHVRKSLEVAPDDPDALMLASYFAFRTGRVRESAELGRRASMLDPLHSRASYVYADAVFCSGHFAEARRLYLEGRARWPQMTNWTVSLMSLLINQRDWAGFAEAEAFAKAHGQLTDPDVRGMRGWARALRDNRADYFDRIRRAIETELAKSGAVPLNLLVGIASVASPEVAYQYVERASYDYIFSDDGGLPSGASGVFTGGVIFSVDGQELLAPDPRFVGLCHKLGLVRFWVNTGLWPDCAEQVSYDFRAEARRLAESEGNATTP